MVNQYFVHILLLVTDNIPIKFLIQWKEENDHSKYFMINLHKSKYGAGIKLMTPGSAIGLAVDCATMPGIYQMLACLCIASHQQLRSYGDMPWLSLIQQIVYKNTLANSAYPDQAALQGQPDLDLHCLLF